MSLKREENRAIPLSPGRKEDKNSDGRNNNRVINDLNKLKNERERVKEKERVREESTHAIAKERRIWGFLIKKGF